jgi:hypothetical protein
MEEIQPATVVIRKNRSIFHPSLVAENDCVNSYLAKHYALLQIVDQAKIYGLKATKE